MPVSNWSGVIPPVGALTFRLKEKVGVVVLVGFLQDVLAVNRDFQEIATVGDAGDVEPLAAGPLAVFVVLADVDALREAAAVMGCPAAFNLEASWKADRSP